MTLLSPRAVANPQCAGFLCRLRRRMSRTKSSSEKQANAKGKAVWHASLPQRPADSSVTVTEVTVLHYSKIFREFVRQSSRVYARNLMRTRLLASAMMLLLSGANSGATAICAAYCMSSVSTGSAVVHHHYTDSDSQLSPTTVSRHTHLHHRGTPCADCPLASKYDLNQKSDCASLAQIQALSESSFSLNASNKVAHTDVLDAPDFHLLLARDRERYLVFDTSQAARSPHPTSVPLRI